MIDWRPLDAALDAAAAQGRRVGFWWRDDDAVAATSALDRLLALARRRGWPLALAAIPARVEPSLAARVAEEPVRLLVHGLAHANHAAAGAKAAEFGADRPPEVAAAEAAEALRLSRAEAGPWLPVFVPPWNRIAPDLSRRLPALGYRGLSTFGQAGGVIPGLAWTNTHLDPVDWRGGRGLAEPAALVARLAGLVATAKGPLGLLTHHLVQDEATWDFCGRLIDRLDHPAVTRLDAETVFGADDHRAGVASVIER